MEHEGSGRLRNQRLHTGPKHHYLNLPRHNDRLARTVQVGSREQVQYYHKNYLDHVYTITDEDGDALEHIRYTAFGLPTYYDFIGLKLATSPTGNQFLWNAKRFDPQLGWYLYHYRHYSPELGRWPSRDPIEEEGGINLYGFVGNDGMNEIDLYGNDIYTREQDSIYRDKISEALGRISDSKLYWEEENDSAGKFWCLQVKTGGIGPLWTDLNKGIGHGKKTQPSHRQEWRRGVKWAGAAKESLPHGRVV